MAERLPSVTQLLKLMDTCHRCSIVFQLTTERSENTEFHGLSEKLTQTLDRFAFELQREIRRIGDDGPLTTSTHRVTCGWERPEVQAGGELRMTLEGYDELLEEGLPCHARAMVQRQRQTLGELLNALTRLSRGAHA